MTYGEDIRQAARAIMVLRRESAHTAASILQEMFPDRQTPDHSTLSLWRSQFDEIQQEERALINQANRTIAIEAQEQTLQALRENRHNLNAVQLMTVAGIAQTKLQEEQRTSQLQPQTPDTKQLVLILGPHQRLTVEDTPPPQDDPDA